MASIIEGTQSVIAAVAALGYEFTINGVNFNGHDNIKILTLNTDARDNVPISLHDASTGTDYVVGTDKVFIAFQSLIYNQTNSLVSRIGEGDVKDGDGAGITKEVLKFSNGTALPFMTSCIGIFVATKFITAETNDNTNYIKTGSVLYGVEVDA